MLKRIQTSQATLQDFASIALPIWEQGLSRANLHKIRLRVDALRWTK